MMEFKARARRRPNQLQRDVSRHPKRVTVNEFQKKGELKSLVKFCKPMNFQELLGVTLSLRNDP